MPLRRQEAGSLLWRDINFKTNTMTIPGKRTKNERPLELVLPNKVIEILQSTPRRGDHVFGAKGVGFTSWSTSMTMLRRRLTVSMAQWTLHDLRRSVATHMAEQLNIEPHIIEEILNHSGYKAGDPDSGDLATTGIILFSAAIPLTDTVVAGNTIAHDTYGIWKTANVDSTGIGANTYIAVGTDVFTF